MTSTLIVDWVSALRWGCIASEMASLTDFGLALMSSLQMYTSDELEGVMSSIRKYQSAKLGERYVAGCCRMFRSWRWDRSELRLALAGCHPPSSLFAMMPSQTKQETRTPSYQAKCRIRRIRTDFHVFGPLGRVQNGQKFGNWRVSRVRKTRQKL